MNIIRATNITPPWFWLLEIWGKLDHHVFQEQFQTLLQILELQVLNMSPPAPARTRQLTVSTLLDPLPSLYPVYHPVNVTPACFAVDEFNKETNAKLHIVRVVAALEELRCGYFRQLLTLEVLDESVAKFYEAVVETKSGINAMRLVNFLEVEGAYFVADSTIASTVASDTGSTLMCDPDYMLARAIEKLPTYGFLLPRPRPSPYPVDHHLIMAPARFAVDEINKEKNANLHLVRVVAAFDRRSIEYFTQQLRLEVLDEGVAKIYGAEVKRKSGSSDMRLVVFYEVGNPS